MSLYMIYFSPTGGTKAVAQQLAKGWNETPLEIDLSDRQLDFAACAFTAQDTCLIAVPSFGGRVPEIALQHLSTISGGGAQGVLVVSYGNRAYDDTLLELQDGANACGFHVIGAVAAATEHSIVHQYGAGRPDMQDCAELTAFGEKLAKRATQAQTANTFTLPGNRPFRPYGGVPLKPTASKHCGHCGLCAKSCPVAAIPEENPSLTTNDVCISCMRCIQICPAKVRSVSKHLLMLVGSKLKKVCASRKSNELFICD